MHFLEWNVSISITISLKFAPKGPINNIPALVQIMAWRRPGDKPLSESMMVCVLTHMCVTRPQWVKGPIDQDRFALVIAVECTEWPSRRLNIHAILTPGNGHLIKPAANAIRNHLPPKIKAVSDVCRLSEINIKVSTSKSFHSLKSTKIFTFRLMIPMQT